VPQPFLKEKDGCVEKIKKTTTVELFAGKK